MIHVKEYIKHISIQFKVNTQCLQEYDQDASWRINCVSAVDIGSGDGSFTSKVLTKFLPENCKYIEGCDKNEEMVQYANDNHRSERVTFKVLDISRVLPEQDYNKFYQAFSFFAIHWSKEQRKIFANIFNLLTPGGGCFLVILGRAPAFFDTFRFLFNKTKWKPWLLNVENAISPYHDSRDPVTEIKQIMADVGFTEIKVSYKKSTHTFTDVEDFRVFIKSINICPIPEADFKEYLIDFERIAIDNGYITDNYLMEFDIFVARGKKN